MSGMVLTPSSVAAPIGEIMCFDGEIEALYLGEAVACHLV
jgi:hypothetical protein